MTADHPDLSAAVAAALDRLEQAADAYSRVCNNHNGKEVDLAVDGLLAARRAAHAAGFVECMVSKKAVEALRDAVSGGATGYAKDCLDLLARDLAPLLKGDL